MFAGPDFVIRWPPDLLADELEATRSISDFDNGSLRKLLNEAFAGDAILDRLNQGEWADVDPTSQNKTASVHQLTNALISAARAGDLRLESEATPRWRRRRGMTGGDSTTEADREPRATLRREFKKLIASFEVDPGVVEIEWWSSASFVL